jgi:hypothetical protein
VRDIEPGKRLAPQLFQRVGAVGRQVLGVGGGDDFGEEGGKLRFALLNRGSAPQQLVARQFRHRPFPRLDTP